MTVESVGSKVGVQIHSDTTHTHHTHTTSTTYTHHTTQGNGHERDFLNDDRVFIIDMYNKWIYPNDREAKGEGRGGEVDWSNVGRWGVHVGEWGGVRVEESRRLKGEDGSALQLPHSVTIVFIIAAAT